MYAFAAQENLVAAVRQAVEDAKVDDVTVHAPFLGKAVIECMRETSASMLQSKINGLRLA